MGTLQSKHFDEPDDLVTLPDLALEDAGEHELRGLPGRSRLHRLVG
jgi:hypothetical protein